ncbi:hypothetical protein EP227_03850 [bacterium]|nr:MAG: hypothetical protein EP227_03850 [bacterium]
MLTATLLLVIALFIPAAPQAVQLDRETGLIIAKGFKTVKGNCTECHSAKLITQNRMDRDDWLETIRWMQREQGLRELRPEVEKEILDYLSAHYAPVKVYRRPPLKVEWE